MTPGRIGMVALLATGCTSYGTVRDGVLDACWDLNSNGFGDAEEDIDGDGRWGVSDCRGRDGAACWDVDLDGAKDPSEDVDHDGVWGPSDCRGLDGTNGTDGTPGVDGAPGAPGEPGTACWDLDEDGVTDPEEDADENGAWDVLDCRGADGRDGAPGQAGAPGAPGQDGAPGAPGQDGVDGLDGLDCWDADGDRFPDPSEDRNGDQQFDAGDCVADVGDALDAIWTEIDLLWDALAELVTPTWSDIADKPAYVGRTRISWVVSNGNPLQFSIGSGDDHRMWELLVSAYDGPGKCGGDAYVNWARRYTVLELGPDEGARWSAATDGQPISLIHEWVIGKDCGFNGMDVSARPQVDGSTLVSIQMADALGGRVVVDFWPLQDPWPR